jgi:MFS family permease
VLQRNHPEQQLRVLKWVVLGMNARIATTFLVVYLSAGGLTPVQIGWVVAAIPISQFLTDIPFSFLADRSSSYHALMAAGIACSAAGFGCFAIQQPSPLQGIGCSVLVGIGYGFFYGTSDAYARQLLHQPDQVRHAEEFELYMGGRLSRTAIMQCLVIFGILAVLGRLLPEAVARLAMSLQALVMLAAFGGSLLLQRVLITKADRTPHGRRWQAWRESGSILLYGAILVSLLNGMYFLAQLRSRELHASTSEITAWYGCFWLGAICSKWLVLPYERILGARRALLGLIILGSTGYTVFAVTPGRGALIGVVLAGVTLALTAPILADRVTHRFPAMPATALSSYITAAAGINGAAVVFAGWAAAQWSVEVAALMLAGFYGAVGLGAGWLARDVKRG